MTPPKLSSDLHIEFHGTRVPLPDEQKVHLSWPRLCSRCLFFQVNHLKRAVSRTADAPGTSNGSTVPSSKRHRSVFQCAKCSFATDSELEFQSHIPQHQVDSSTAQCLLCGLCYTSASSLNRHLFIVHKVRDQEEEEEEEEIVEVKVEATDPEACSGEEVAMETRENGLEECASEPPVADLEPRRSLGLTDSAQDPQNQPQASQDQNSHVLSPQV